MMTSYMGSLLATLANCAIQVGHNEAVLNKANDDRAPERN